jgi:hypothetical protein
MLGAGEDLGPKGLDWVWMLLVGYNVHCLEALGGLEQELEGQVY